MILSEINLENIRSHSITKIKFSEGINIITGNTGSGKSSILMSVEYALFGKIGEGKDEGKMLLRRNAKDGSVTLKILDGKNEYEVSRGLKRVNEAVRNDDSKNYINKDNTRVDLQNRASDINSYVNRILNIYSENPLKMFETITYIKQDELKNLIFETGQYKQEYIDGLLQLNKYLTVYEKMREIISEIKKEIDIDRKEIELSVDENEIIKTETKINENKTRIEQIKKQEENDNILLENKKIAKKQKDSEVEFERSQKLKFTKISTEIKLKEAEIEKYRAEIAKIQVKIEQDSKKILYFDEKRKDYLDKELKEIEIIVESENEQVKKTYAELYKAEYSYKNTIDEKNKLKEEEKREKLNVLGLEKEKTELETQIANAPDSENKDEIKGRISEVQTIQREIESEKEKAIKSGTCQLCGEKITSEEHIKEEYNKKIKECEEKISKLSKDYENIKLSKNELEKRFETIKLRLSTENEKLSAINDRLIALDEENRKAEYEQVKKRYDEENKKLENLSNQLKKLREESKLLNEHEKIAIEIKNNSKRIEEIEETIKSTSNYLEKLQSEIKDVNFQEDHLKKLEEELKLITDETNTINYRITELKKEKEMRENQLIYDENILKELEIKIKKKMEVTEKLAKKEKLLKLMSNLREDIRNIREYVRLRFINEFRSLFKTRFEELRNESDYSIDIDKNYNVVISAGNEEMDARTLSGGEKTSVAIAYRLALSSLASILGGVSKNELILMDEPTSGLDKEDINALTNAITRINDLKQIIIVTHEDSMKNIADNVIKLKKNGGVSILY